MYFLQDSNNLHVAVKANPLSFIRVLKLIECGPEKFWNNCHQIGVQCEFLFFLIFIKKYLSSKGKISYLIQKILSLNREDIDIIYHISDVSKLVTRLVEIWRIISQPSAQSVRTDFEKKTFWQKKQAVKIDDAAMEEFLGK